jgi:hypothetical protein
MIKNLCADADTVLIESFESGSLPLKDFRHQIHVRLVFLYLKRFSVQEVLVRFPTALVRYANAHGKHGLYNETITWSYIFLIRERLARANPEITWEEFQARNQDLMTWKENILKKYYRDETLSSALAKETFLFPDKHPPNETLPDATP